MEQKCIHCGEWSNAADWKETDYAGSCELCGEHAGEICPKCNEPNDTILNDLETRPT